VPEVEFSEWTTTGPTEGAFDADAYGALGHEADLINARFTAFDDPVQLEEFFTSLTGLLNEATPPPAVADEFVRFRTAYVDLQAQLEAGAYSIAVLQQTPILSDANVNAAITAVDAHDLELCGEAPGLEAAREEAAGATGDDSTDGSTGLDADNPFAEALATGDFTAIEALLATDVGREAFIEGFIGNADGVTPEQGSCFLDNTDISVLAEMSVDPSNLSDDAVTQFLAALDACDIPLSAFQLP